MVLVTDIADKDSYHAAGLVHKSLCGFVDGKVGFTERLLNLFPCLRIYARPFVYYTAYGTCRDAYLSCDIIYGHTDILLQQKIRAAAPPFFIILDM